MSNMEGKMRKTLLCILFIVSIGTVNAESRKFVGGESCLVSQFCEQQNAIEALRQEFNMTLGDAGDYVRNQEIERSCSCQDSCVYLGVCCRDKVVHVPSKLQALSDRLKQDPSSYRCEEKLGKDTIVITTCLPSAPIVMKKRCAKESDLELLVTSNETKLTYKNMYCGLCNGENFQQLKGWAWNFDCIKDLPTDFPPVLSSIVPLVTLDPASTGNSILDKAQQKSCKLNNTIPMIPPVGVEVHHDIGVYLDSFSICSHPPIASCPTNSEDELCQTGPISLILYDGQVYRNKYCLRCNEGMAQESMAICDSCENEGCKHPTIMIHNRPLVGSFGVLVQPYDETRVVECKTKNQQDCSGILDNLVTCGHGQYLQFQSSTCISICPENYVLQDGSCEFIGFNSTCKNYVSADEYSKIVFTGNDTNQLHIKTFMALGDSQSACYNCSRLIDINSDPEDFKINKNGDIEYLENPVSRNLVYQVDSVTYFVCIDGVSTTEETEKDYTIEEVISYLLLSISMFSLLLYFVAYLIFKRLRNVPGKIVAGNMACLFFAYLFFVIREVPRLENTTGCIVVGILINYFFLASFIFNIIYACFIVHSLDFIDFELNVTRWTAARMWLIGLFVPFLVIIPGIIMDNVVNTASNEGLVHPQYGGDQCFIGNEHGIVAFFIAPIGLCLFLAVCLYITIIIKLIQLAKQTSQVRSNHSEKITVAIKLLVVLGFNWIFAVIAAIERGRLTTYIFIVTCTLQGFFGFVVFICNKATITDIKRHFRKKDLPYSGNSSSGSVKSKATTTTELKKNNLRQMDSSKALLKGSGEASV